MVWLLWVLALGFTSGFSSFSFLRLFCLLCCLLFCLLPRLPSSVCPVWFLACLPMISCLPPCLLSRFLTRRLSFCLAFCFLPRLLMACLFCILGFWFVVVLFASPPAFWSFSMLPAFYLLPNYWFLILWCLVCCSLARAAESLVFNATSLALGSVLSQFWHLVLGVLLSNPYFLALRLWSLASCVLTFGFGSLVACFLIPVFKPLVPDPWFLVV